MPAAINTTLSWGVRVRTRRVDYQDWMTATFWFSFDFHAPAICILNRRITSDIVRSWPHAIMSMMQDYAISKTAKVMRALISVRTSFPVVLRLPLYPLLYLLLLYSTFSKFVAVTAITGLVRRLPDTAAEAAGLRLQASILQLNVKRWSFSALSPCSQNPFLEEETAVERCN